MKRSLFLIIAFAALLCGCSRKNSFTKYPGAKDLKVGFVYPGKINDKGYTQSQDAGRLALERKGIRTMYVEDVPENEVSEIVIKELVKQGCKMIFATSSGYRDYVTNMAVDFPYVKFAHCDGDEKASNVSCYSGRMYEARYLAGIVAGLQTTANKIGYLAAFPTPEYIREVNAFTLGVKSVNPDAIVHVRWTKTKSNVAEENYRADELLMLGCDVLTQHLNSNVAYSIAEKKGVYFIGCNYPAKELAPRFYLTSVCYNWEVFVVDEVQRFLENTWEPRFYWEGLSTDIVSLGELSRLCIPGAKNSVENARRKIISGELNIFSGPIYDKDQNIRIDEGQELDSLGLWNMNWFVDGVKLSQY